MAVKNKVPPVDANAQARDRAGKKVAAKRGISEDLPEEMPTEAPAAEAEAEAEGGIVAEAEKEVAMVSEEAKEPEGQPEAEGEVEGKAESEAEPYETPASEGEGEMEPAGPEKAPGQPEAKAPVSEYQPPEGADHDELIDQYHEALAFGDLDSAKALYKQLQEHRYKENAHKTVSDAQASKDEQEYLDTAKELAALHPELNVDGIEADKVLALKDIYWQNGDREADALRKAVADLYPEGSAPTTPVEAPVPEEPEEPAEEMPMAAEAAPEAAPESANVTEMPGMEERKARKRNIPSIPSASAKVAPPEEAPQATRSSAIADMKARRNQA